MDISFDKLTNKLSLLKTDFSFLRMDIDIQQSRRNLEMKNKNRISLFIEALSIPFFDCPGHLWRKNRTAVHKEILPCPIHVLIFRRFYDSFQHITLFRSLEL